MIGKKEALEDEWLQIMYIIYIYIYTVYTMYPRLGQFPLNHDGSNRKI